MVEMICLALAGDEQVEPAVVVVIGPGGTIRVEWLGEPGVGCHVGEVSATIISQEARANRMGKPCAAGNEHVEAAVVVVVGLIAYQAPQLISDAGFIAVVFKGAITRVAIDGHRHGGIHRRDNDIEEVVSVEVVHDGPTGLIESIELDRRADVTKHTDVEFRMKEPLERQRESLVDLRGIFSQCHMSHIEEPLHAEVVRETSKVVGEMADCEPRAAGVRMYGGGRDRNDA